MALSPTEQLIVQMNPLFGGLPIETLKIIFDHNPPGNYTKKSLLFQEGDKADHFYLVIDGLVKLFRSSLDGHEAVISVFGKGQTFAECAMFMGASFPVSAEVVSNARLLRIEGATMRRVVKDDPDIAFTMLASAARHLKMMVDQIEQIKVHTGPERVAEFLLGLSSSSAGVVTVNLPFEKTLIANTLGMKPESFSRALAKLREVGVITNGDHVMISDVGALVRYARSRSLEDICAPCEASELQDA